MSSNPLHRESDHCLPSEVLSQVFSFLMVRDKKNVRLTCSQWYNACNVIPLLQYEKMIIHIPFNYIEVFDMLMKCRRLRFNLEFKKVSFYQSSLFWKKCGSRIESLKLQECQFDEESACEMIISCNNLKELHIDSIDETFFSNNSLQECFKPKICHKSLISLTLEKCHNVTDFILNRLFDIYPRIQQFVFKSMHFNCHRRIDSRFYKPTTENFTSDLILSFSCLFARIKLNAEIITKIVLDEIGDGGITDDWLEQVGSLSAPKLREITLKYHPHLTEKAFLKFFSFQTNLECVRINKCRDFSLKCLLHMIRNCSNLEYLQVESSDMNVSFSVGKEILLALMLLPNLKVLKLTGSFFMEENINFVAPITVDGFKKLCQLRLEMPTKYFDIFIPRVPPSLLALNLIECGTNGLTDRNLQAIFHKLINLRSLKATLDSTVTDFGFTGSQKNRTENSGIAISRLKQLEKLSLRFNKYVLGSVTEATFSHFAFPDLRQLKLHNLCNISEKSYELLSRNNPSIEFFELEKSKIDCITLLKICKHWRRLRGVRVMLSENVYSDLKILFELCPELKFYQTDEYPSGFLRSY